MRSARLLKSPPLGGSRTRSGLLGRLALCAVAWLAVAASTAAPAAVVATAPVAVRGELAQGPTSLHLPSYLDARSAEGPASGIDAFRKRLELQGRPGGFAPAPQITLVSSVLAGRDLDSSLSRPGVSVGVLLPYRSTAPPVA